MDSRIPTQNYRPNRIRFLTYNIGLLRYEICGYPFFENPPFAKERFPYIVQALKEYCSNIDVLVIQECYEVNHAKFLEEQLHHELPFSCRVSSNTLIKLNNGLLIISRFPIVDYELEQYHKVSSLEAWCASKSNLSATLQIPDLGEVTFINMHTTAGGANMDCEGEEADADRQAEIDQVFGIARRHEARGRLTILCGDFNCGPEASSGNFNYLLKGGYRDAFEEAVREMGREGEGEVEGMTWDPKNYLNAIGPHAHCSALRCDHLVVPTACGLRGVRAQTLFRDPCVSLASGVQCTLSDHYGMALDLAWE